MPTHKDFARLDPRFQLPVGFWDALPQYADYGFAAFRLKSEAESRQHFHPMALEFPRRSAAQRFFPTVHARQPPAQTQTAVFTYLESDYHPRRPHSTLGRRNPIDFERKLLLAVSSV